MIYLVICILIGVVSAGVQNYYCKNLFHNVSDNLLYQLITYGVGLVCSLVTAGFLLPSGYTAMLAIIAGILIMLEVYCILRSMTKGPMSLTSLFSMAALIIPVCLTPVLWKEPLTISQIIGTVLVVVSMFLTLDVPGELKARAQERTQAAEENTAGGEQDAAANGKRKKTDLSWLPYAFGAFLFGGCCAIPEKYLVNSAYADESGAYASITFIVVLLLTALTLLYRRKAVGERPTMKLTAKLVIPLLFLGCGSAAVVLLIIEALKYLPTSVTYGGHNGTRLILITIMDVVLFKQKLKPIQIVGMAIGLAALICLSM